MKRLKDYVQLGLLSVSTIVLGVCATFLTPLTAHAAPTNCTAFNVGDDRETTGVLPGTASVAWLSYRDGSTDPASAFLTLASSGCSDINVAYIHNSINRLTGDPAPSQCDHFYLQYTDSQATQWQNTYTAGADACTMSGGQAKVIFHGIPNGVHFRVWARPVGVTSESQVAWIQPYYTIYY